MPQLLLRVILAVSLLVAFVAETRAEGGSTEVNFSIQVSEVAVEYTKMLNGVSVVLQPQIKAGVSSSSVTDQKTSLELVGEVSKLVELGDMALGRFNLSQNRAKDNDYLLTGTYRGVFPVSVLTGNGGIARFYNLPSSVLVGSYTLSLTHPLCGRLSTQVYISDMTVPTLPLVLSYTGPCGQS